MAAASAAVASLIRSLVGVLPCNADAMDSGSKPTPASLAGVRSPQPTRSQIVLYAP